MKRFNSKHSHRAFALTFATTCVFAPTQYANASTNLEVASTATQGEFMHAVVTLAIVITLVGISRLTKKSS